LSSTLTTTTGVTYRWDFGDGTPYSEPYESDQASHTYAVCGTYDVRVEVTDSFGNRVIGSLSTYVTECTTTIFYFPIWVN
jgi:PKD repeat protein